MNFIFRAAVLATLAAFELCVIQVSREITSMNRLDKPIMRSLNIKLTAKQRQMFANVLNSYIKQVLISFPQAWKKIRMSINCWSDTLKLAHLNTQVEVKKKMRKADKCFPTRPSGSLYFHLSSRWWMENLIGLSQQKCLDKNIDPGQNLLSRGCLYWQWFYDVRLSGKVTTNPFFIFWYVP